MECPLWRLLISSRSVSKHGHHMQFLFLIGRFLKNLLLWNCLAIWTETWYEASTCMEGSVLSFLKAEWKVSNTGSAHWASSYGYTVDVDSSNQSDCAFKKNVFSRKKLRYKMEKPCIQLQYFKRVLARRYFNVP